MWKNKPSAHNLPRYAHPKGEVRRLEYRYSILLLLSFFLGNYGGKIALWRSGTEEPIQVFPYSVASLPSADQEKLNTKIEIKTEQALIQLLEDYLS